MPATSVSRAKRARPAPKVHKRKTAPPAPLEPAAIGSEIRAVVTRLERLHAYSVVCCLALEGQGTEHDRDVAVVLKRGIGDLLYNCVRRLQRLASQCDGLPPSEDEELRADDFEGIDDDGRMR